MIARNALLAVLLTLMMTPWSVIQAKTYDVLEMPAVPSDLASTSLVFSIGKYFDRYFAVGQYGHILYSDDAENWTQAQVPVRSSLLDITFATPEKGWAVGHEGVILHSSDGGKTWVKQFDGLRYGREGKAYYEELVAQDPNEELYPFLVDEMDFAISQGADKPLFRVYFHDENRGHALGAYGMILQTMDGGKNWKHVLHNMENDSFYHIFDATPLPEDGKFFISGEAGLFMIGDINEQVAVQTESVPWEGSFFTTIAAADGGVITGGLRGRMFITNDEGVSWQAVEKPPTSSIVDSARLPNGNLVAVGIAGEVLLSTDNGMNFSRLPINTGGRIYAVAEGPEGTLLFGGPSGISKYAIPQ